MRQFQCSQLRKCTCLAAIFSIRFKLLATIFQHSISIGGAPRSKISSCHFEISVKMLLTYFTSMFYFHTPWTRHETIDFWRFQGVYKWNISMKLVKCSMKCLAKKVMMSNLFLWFGLRPKRIIIQQLLLVYDPLA